MSFSKERERESVFRPSSTLAKEGLSPSLPRQVCSTWLPTQFGGHAGVGVVRLPLPYRKKESVCEREDPLKGTLLSPTSGSLKRDPI